jgi:toxin-antitoxin system PIN domain toxin
MIAPDVNLLLYAYDSASEFHDEASAFWSDALPTPEPVGIPAQCLYGFVRIITNAKIGPSAIPMTEALNIANEWFALPQVRLLQPTDRHWPLLRESIIVSRAFGPFVSDAAIAATVMEFGATLCTNDKGFARFDGLKWKNPLKPSKR